MCYTGTASVKPEALRNAIDALGKDELATSGDRVTNFGVRRPLGMRRAAGRSPESRPPQLTILRKETNR